MSEHYKQVERCLDNGVASFKAALKLLKTLEPEEHAEMAQWTCALSLNVAAWKMKHARQLRVVDPVAPPDG